MTIEEKTVIRGDVGRSKTLYISVPSFMTQDSQFPFKAGEMIMIRIAGKSLIVEKIE